jgi:peptidoglycan/xylan/chitin deacetylase (PgdA/CDA1 family)
MQGRWVEAYPDTARAVVDGGHLVGNHSFYHARMPLLTEAGFAEDIRGAESVIRDTLNVDPQPWFRYPFGSGEDDPELTARLDRLGYRNAGWDVDGQDWDPARTVDQLVETVVAGVLAAGDSSIVLCHSWPRPTAAAMARIVPRLRDAGAEFVGVDALPTVIPSAAVPASTAPEEA